MISIAMINSLCRKLDLVFVEMGQVNDNKIYWFIDYNNKRRSFTGEEIEYRINEQEPV